MVWGRYYFFCITVEEVVQGNEGTYPKGCLAWTYGSIVSGGVDLEDSKGKLNRRIQSLTT
jgi:hypothetical protein